jgi:hypothetical protein
MTQEDITSWALANGWQIIAGCPSLTKPSAPKEAIVRLVLKATVANLEVKKPAGKWEKFSGAATPRSSRMKIPACRAGWDWRKFPGSPC